MNRINGHLEKVSGFKDRTVLIGSSKATKKHKVPNNVLDDKDLSHILWWKEVCHLSSSCFKLSHYFLKLLLF